MTLNDIISTSLVMLERGTDAHTIDHYRAQFTKYANDAVEEIIKRVKQERKQVFVLSIGTFSVNDLERGCIRVTMVRANGSPVFYQQDPEGSGIFVVNTDAEEVEVYYRFYPKPMSSSTDTPELPEHMHSVIPYYVVACTRCGGDPYTQGASSAHFSIFNNKVRDLERMHRGEPNSFKLLHY